jgi:hypothetical protein
LLYINIPAACFQVDIDPSFFQRAPLATMLLQSKMHATAPENSFHLQHNGIECSGAFHTEQSPHRHSLYKIARVRLSEAL